MYKALVIRDDKNKFHDLEDVIKVARSQGQQLFKTRGNVKVVRIWGPDPEVGYVVVVEAPREFGCSKSSDVRGFESTSRNG